MVNGQVLVKTIDIFQGISAITGHITYYSKPPDPCTTEYTKLDRAMTFSTAAEKYHQEMPRRR